MTGTKSLVTTAVTISLLYGAFAHAQTNWTTFGFDRQRTGYNPEEAILSRRTVPSLAARWSIDLGAPMTAQPIEVDGILYAATWGGGVYAINPASGSVLWAADLGTVPTSCSDFAPGYLIGVIHTLTSDQGNGRIYAISGDGLLHALDAVTGKEWPGYPIQVMDSANIGQTFVYGSPTYSFENGSLYIATASACDEGSYRGQVVQVDVMGHTPQVTGRWFVDGINSPFGGGIWGPGGVALDPALAIYTGTGNALTDPENYGYADQVLRLDLDLNVIAADGPSISSGDLDFGSTPVLYQAPNCPPQLAVMNKNGALYVYSRDYIVSGPVQVLQISGEPTYIGAVAYDPVLNQVYTGNTADDGVGIFNHGIIAFTPQSDCTLSLAWQQPVGPNGGSPVIPPVAANGVVYYSTGAGSQVYAFDAVSGRYLWDSGSLMQNGIYASPMVVNGQLFAAAFDHKLYAFGPTLISGH